MGKDRWAEQGGVVLYGADDRSIADVGQPQQGAEEQQQVISSIKVVTSWSKGGRLGRIFSFGQGKNVGFPSRMRSTGGRSFAHGRTKVQNRLLI